MITRFYFLKASQQVNGDGMRASSRGVANKEGTLHSSRVIMYKSIFKPKPNDIVNDFLDEISKENNLPNNGWFIESFNRL